MDFTLVPVCSEKEHELDYDYKEGYKCEICFKTGVSYRCNNCDYRRCSKCHRDILASEEIKERLKIAKFKNDIKIAEHKLKRDNLEDWEVMVSNSEIYYINKLTLSYSYDYPYSINDKIIREDTPRYSRESNNYRCTFTEIYNTIKSFF